MIGRATMALLETLGKGVITAISLVCYITGTVAQNLVNVITGQHSK